MSGGSSSSTTSTSTTAAPGTSSSETTDADPGTSSSSSTSSGGEAAPVCGGIAISLVIDRQAPVYGYEKRLALAEFLDAVVVQTGARVTIMPNAGAAVRPQWDCELPADGFVWGDAFERSPGAYNTLDCIFSGAQNYPHGSDDDGDHMFTGLMFPILEEEAFPPADTSLALALMLAATDDDEPGMYPRPGMASEAFLRLAADGNRRKAIAMSAGADGDQVHTFALSVSERSRYYDWNDHDLPAMLEMFLPEVLAACEESEVDPLPQPPGGCEHIDVLFVVDGSLSMAQEQAALRGIVGPPVFAEFTDALTVQLDTLVDMHIGVISSEPDTTTLHTHAGEPATAPSPATDCGLPPGQRWLVAPSPSLAEDFACIAGTQMDSTVESTTRNAAEALSNPANAGFLRDDAVLFIVMITDEDTLDYTTRIAVREQILAAVDDDLSRVVVLGIAGDQGVFEMPKTTCAGVYGTATPGRKISSIVFSFREQGIMQDICGGDLAALFDEALDDLVNTCLDFHPEG